MENSIKNLLLDYAAHLSINCEFINPKNLREKTVLKDLFNSKQKVETLPYRRRSENGVYKAHSVANCLANVLLIVDKLMENNAKLLIINGDHSKLQLYVPKATQISLLPKETYKARLKHWQGLRHKFPSLLQGGWVNGALSNWSRLRKVAWTSHELVRLTKGRRRLRNTQMESWLSEVFSIFRGLQVSSAQLMGHKTHIISKPMLAYKHKADCVFVINGSQACVRECKALNVPLCILSSSTKFKISASYLESNQESCFLTYILVSAILNLKKPENLNLK